MTTAPRTRALRTAAIIIGAAVFVQSLHGLGRERVLEGLRRVGWGFAAIVLLSGAREAARTLAWMRTVEGPVPLRFRQAFRARLVGEALNTLLPMGMVVGEPTKASHAGRDIPFATAFSALAVEFAFYCGSLVLLFCAGFSALVVATEVQLSAPVISFGLVIGTAAALLLPRVRRTWRGRAHSKVGVGSDGRIANIRRRAVDGLRHLYAVVFGFASRHPEHVRAIITFEIAYQIFAVAEVYFTLRLVSPLPPTLASAVVLETVSRAITMAFKILPMRVGVDEVGSSVFAEHVRLSAATGLTLALVRKLRLLFWSAVGLALLVRWPSGATPSVAHS